ncbi:hypothetical protein [Pseudonocardia lacus]|uniref:hypothetical protein n=1 Tax=Pseudonocardia lacus TaxID=2835865 RepID=UPI001BDD09C4|nr:hypothetical protein [Pseudonocardia lacus]
MQTTSSDRLIRRFIAGDRAASGVLVERAGGSDEPAVLVAAALVVPAWAPLLARAARAARSGRDRQLVEIAAAHLRGEVDRVLLLARDHLADHPDSLLAAHIAASCTDAPETGEHL